MAGDDVTVVVGGVRVRRDEAAALGIEVPGAAAPAPEPVDDEPKKKPAPRKSRAVPNKSRTVSDK